MADDMRQREVIVFAGWVLAGLAVLSACQTGLHLAIGSLGMEFFGSGPEASNWIFDSLRRLGEWQLVSALVVCAGLAGWLRGPTCALARGLFAGAAVAGLVALICNPTLLYSVTDFSFVERFFGVILTVSRFVWLIHFVLIAAGIAALGAALDSEKTTVLAALAVCVGLCMALGPLVDLFVGAGEPGQSPGALRRVASMLLPVGDLLLAAMAVILARLAQSTSGDEGLTVLRRALFLVCAGLSARVLVSVYAAVEATVSRGSYGYDAAREMLMQTSTVGMASVVAALVPLVGAYVLWHSTRGDDDRAPRRFAWTLGCWSTALVFELVSVGYATQTVLSDTYVNFGDVLMVTVVVGAIGALFGLFGMMALFGGLAELAARFEGARWQDYAVRAQGVPKVLGAAMAVGLVSSVMLRALSGGFGGPPLGLLAVVGLGMGSFALFVAWQVFSTLLGITRRLVHEPEHEQPVEDVGW